MKSTISRLLAGAAVVLAASSALAQNTWVRVTTTQGAIDMKLLDTEAPLTVANFLGYVNRQDYTDVFVHRDAWATSTIPFVIQTGGYRWPGNGSMSAIPTQPAVANEYSPLRSNIKGTVAMAKLGSDPNSATSQWFVNMSDNSSNLDNQNGGFTVFARVTEPGMVVANRISNLPHPNVTTPLGTFNGLPLQNWQSGASPTRDNFVLITDARPLATSTDYDRVFNYLEAKFPQYAQPANGTPGVYQQYHYRFYSGTNAYLGTDGTNVCYLLPPDNNIHCDLGTVNDWLGNAQSEGY